MCFDWKDETENPMKYEFLIVEKSDEDDGIEKETPFQFGGLTIRFFNVHTATFKITNIKSSHLRRHLKNANKRWHKNNGRLTAVNSISDLCVLVLYISENFVT